MPRKTYTPEERARVLARCEEIGVPKTCEETGISIQTLYAWRNKAKPIKSPVAVPAKQAAAPKETKAPAEELLRLRVENNAMKEQILTLKKALRAFSE
ncbi:MAG: transposase [Clostridia bacterium]|nr:transposase [Clostridia bacterium]